MSERGKERKKEGREKGRRALEECEEQLGALLGTMRRRPANRAFRRAEEKMDKVGGGESSFACRWLEFFCAPFNPTPPPPLLLSPTKPMHCGPLVNKCKEKQKMDPCLKADSSVKFLQERQSSVLKLPVAPPHSYKRRRRHCEGAPRKRGSGNIQY